MLDFVDGCRKVRKLRRLVLVDPRTLAARDAIMLRQLQRDTGPLRAGLAIFNVVSEGLLPAVEIDGRDTLSGLEKRHRNMHRGGGFARSALLVAEHDHMRGTRYTTCCLKQHTPTPERSII